MSYAVLCAGQGAQHAAMLDVLGAHPAAAAVLEESAAALGQNPRDWLTRPADIFRNSIAQPLICITELASWAALDGELPPPMAFAGYSVGELAAYACARALGARDLVRLAVDRASAMDRARSGRPAALIAVKGLTRDVVAALCEAVGAWISIANADDRFVLGGPGEDIDALTSALEQRGAHVTRLSVEIAAHTPLLAPAAEEFRLALAGSPLRSPAVPVVAGVDASWVTCRSLAIETLSRQIASTVEWGLCMDTLYERGCRLTLEIGPGKALSKMMCERYPDVQSRAVEEFRSVRAILDWVGSRAA